MLTNIKKYYSAVINLDSFDCATIEISVTFWRFSDEGMGSSVPFLCAFCLH